MGCSKPSIEPDPQKPSEGKYYVKRVSYPDAPPIAGGDFYFTYNGANKVVVIEQKNVGTIKIDYNNEGLISKTTSTGLFPGYTNYFYTNGQLVREERYQIETDQAGGTQTRKQSFEYVLGNDNKPLLIRAYNNTDAVKASAQIMYDDNGNPVKITSSSGIEYSYTYNNENYVLFPENEGIYNCLENLIVFTSILSYSVPAELNYRIPFQKQIKDITYQLPNGATQRFTFHYQKNEQGLTRQLTASYGSGSSPTVYTFEYERR